MSQVFVCTSSLVLVEAPSSVHRRDESAPLTLLACPALQMHRHDTWRIDPIEWWLLNHVLPVMAKVVQEIREAKQSSPLGSLFFARPTMSIANVLRLEHSSLTMHFVGCSSHSGCKLVQCIVEIGPQP